MKRKKILQRLCALCLAALFCWSGLGQWAQGAGRAERTVRIPCGINDLLYLDKAGEPAGRYVTYLSKLAQVNGWRFEYVETTWTQAVKQLEDGELDLLFPTNYSEARTATMDYSTLVAGYTAPGLFARADSGYDYEDFSSFNGARIAVTQGSSNEQALIHFAQSRGFTYEPVYIESNNEKTQALVYGNVDMIILTVENNLSNTILVSVMDASPFYFTVKKGNEELLSQLNQGMQQIVKTDPELVGETFYQCLLGENGSMLAFTREERVFVETGRPVVVGFYEGNDPLAHPRLDGSWGGIYAEMMEYVEENSGIELVLQPIGRDENWQELLKDGTLDFYIGASTSLADQDSSFRATDTFLEYDNVMVTRNDCAFGELEAPVVALTYNRAYMNSYLFETMGVGEMRFYPSAKDCLIAVMKGEADGTVLNNIEYNYESKNSRFANMLQWENYRVTAEGGLVAAADVDPIVFSAVNKAVALLSHDVVNTMVSDNFNMPYTFSVTDTLYIFRYPLLVAGGVLLLGCVLWVIFRRVRRKQKAVKAQTEEREHHQLRIQAALSRNYDAVYYTDLDDNRFEVVQIADQTRERMGQAIIGSRSYSDALRQYAENFVLPEYQAALLVLSDPKAIIQRFQETSDFSLRYRVKPNETGREFYEVHLVDVSEKGKEHAMVFGVRCIDETVKTEREQRQLLEDALAAANKAGSAKSDFLSKMSHDIRTPMNAIIGMTAIAGAHLDDTERVKDVLGKISSSSRYLLGLINEVLDMSKIESGAISLNEEPFNLSDLLNNLLIMVQPQIKEHGHNLEVHIQDIQHEDVLGDSLRIQQAFVNIMGNAVKYTPDGGKITLTVRELPMRSPKLAGYEFTFRDNGIGMSKEYMERIFEPFSRAEDVRVSKIQGTGLGMAITQNIVHQMNGSIEVESEEGKGSTFVVTMYLKLQEARELDASELAELPVLVVDDDPDACESVCELLDQIGMKSEGCDSGQEAVEAVKRTMGTPEQFYAAILDWRMPGMDGVETAKAIKRLAGEELPIIILSAYDWSDIEMEARAAGVDAFLSKPVFKSGLIRQFKTLKSAEEEPPAAGAENQLQEIQNSDYTGTRALLVEDNDLNREIAREIMEMAGLQVEEAENGKEAVDKVMASEKGYYDIIFMDIQMPVMSGYDAAMAIRALGHADSLSIPIIAMTANAFVEDIQASKAAGMNEHLAKPIDFAKFNAILKKYLS